MELIVTCPNCETQETVYIAGTFGFVTCQGCDLDYEVDVALALENESETQPETPTLTATL